MNLRDNIDVVRVLWKSSASTAVSAALDVSNCEGVLFIASLSTLAEGSSRAKMWLTGSTALAGTYKRYGSTYVAASYDTAPFAMSSTAFALNSKNAKVLIMDLHKPLKPYAKAVIAGCSSGSAYANGVVAIKYGLRYSGSTAAMASTTLAGSTKRLGSKVQVSPTS